MHTTPRIHALCFDLDGTLVDSAAGIAHALNTSLQSVGLRRFELDTVRGWVGDGPDVLIRRALEACALRAADLTALAAQLRTSFDAVTLREPMAEGAAYDGVGALLHALSADYPLAVVTNKPTPLARAVLDAAGLLGAFDSVHGADTPAQRKPAPLLIQQACAQLDVPVADTLMVGDGPADLLAARAAGCHAAWVSWGYGHAQAAPPPGTWQLDTPQQLLERLQAPQPPAPIH
ncbi:MAG: HAD-IA family hydrolase [Rhizobacter sp.]|nr:HAD-IA family hydrolase [Rhizobacter sp.]